MSPMREWEATYQRGEQINRWPWSDVVSLVARHTPLRAGLRVLELGCGSGANIPYFKSTGCDYYSIEGSATALANVWAQHPDMRKHAVPGDFTRDLPFAGEFDLVVDRGALVCNDEVSIRRALGLVLHVLKSGGGYVGVDWFSVRHSDYLLGHGGSDPLTRTDYESGVFAGLGPIHFSDEAHLRDLFCDFEFVILEHKLVERVSPSDGWKSATWNFVCRKPFPARAAPPS